MSGDATYGGETTIWTNPSTAEPVDVTVATRLTPSWGVKDGQHAGIENGSCNVDQASSKIVCTAPQMGAMGQRDPAVDFCTANGERGDVTITVTATRGNAGTISTKTITDAAVSTTVQTAAQLAAVPGSERRGGVS